MKTRIHAYLLTFIILSSGSIRLLAQEENKSNLIAPSKDKKIRLNFEDELINGQRFTPEAQLINSKKGSTFKKLIKIRENFNMEMDKSKNAFQK